MKLSEIPNKSFREDIRIISNSLWANENISISKFCDGELSIILNKEIDNGEFSFNPRNKEDQQSRQMLIEAFQFQHPQYYVGITCTRVFGIHTHRQMKMISGQPESRLTWADIWVNSNYRHYVEHVIPLFSKKDTVLICNTRGIVENLPFIPRKIFRVNDSAIRTSRNVVDEAKEYIDKHGLRDTIFLFCCGPFGNVLCHKLTEHNSNNTYLDVGSTLNPYLQSEGFKRDYYMGDNFFSQLEGQWDNGR